MKLAHFVQFYDLLDAVGLAIVSNFWDDSSAEQLNNQKMVGDEKRMSDLADLIIQYE